MFCDALKVSGPRFWPEAAVAKAYPKSHSTESTMTARVAQSLENWRTLRVTSFRGSGGYTLFALRRHHRRLVFDAQLLHLVEQRLIFNL